MVNKKEAIEALTAYVQHILNGPQEAANVTRFDLMRKSLHRKVAEAFGVLEDYNYEQEHDRKYYPLQLPCDPVKWLADWKGMDVDDYVEFAYWAILDMVNNKNHSIKTHYTLKLKLDNDFASYKRKVLAELDEYIKMQTEYFKELKDKYPDKFYSEHDFNGSQWNVKDALDIIEQFAAFPIEAYLKPAIDEYYHRQMKRISDNMTAIKAWLFFWKQELKKKGESK